LIKNKEFVEADIKLNGVFKLRTDDSRLTILKQNIEKGILSADKKQKSKRTIVIALLIISGSIFGYYLFQRYVEYENWATIVKDTSIVNVQAYIAANSTSKYLSLANEKLRELLLKDSLEKANQEELRRIELSLATSKIPTTPEELFIQWEKEIESKGIFDYVSETDCMDRNKMDDLYYNQSKYPMHTTSKEIITFDYNSDGISDYLINYNLENCVNGNGWATDFIFIVSSSGKLVIDQDLSKIIKTQFYDYVKSNYSSDPYVYLDNSYLVTNALNISSISNGIGFGNFKLLQNGPSCCPEITGDFEFNFTTSELTFSNIVKNTNDKIE
jgi:hypothetical protein